MRVTKVSDRPWRFLGDGVYALFDGYHIVLRIGSHDNDASSIHLEPEVLVALNQFNRDIHEQVVTEIAKEAK
jgi:hypothetical protein